MREVTCSTRENVQKRSLLFIGILVYSESSCGLLAFKNELEADHSFVVFILLLFDST